MHVSSSVKKILKWASSRNTFPIKIFFLRFIVFHFVLFLRGDHLYLSRLHNKRLRIFANNRKIVGENNGYWQCVKKFKSLPNPKSSSPNYGILYSCSETSGYSELSKFKYYQILNNNSKWNFITCKNIIYILANLLKHSRILPKVCKAGAKSATFFLKFLVQVLFVTTLVLD